ncbi:serine/arginine repetitive matrix protein 1-like [Eucalyptus grandis]|uniref:serine/arginine repetitive matrix protein 1-like n=1 Tax=Eucalyptus grandis TaxID=71139 RepID=UPI00192EAAC4|nr:serine/arginine repetitive matrix protein 1-like [Eucalyptus grandis]
MPELRSLPLLTSSHHRAARLSPAPGAFAARLRSPDAAPAHPTPRLRSPRPAPLHRRSAAAELSPFTTAPLPSLSDLQLASTARPRTSTRSPDPHSRRSDARRSASARTGPRSPSPVFAGCDSSTTGARAPPPPTTSSLGAV